MVDKQMWNFIIYSFFFFYLLGYPKIAVFYCAMNELFWEDEEEEDEIEAEENIEDYSELDLEFQDVPLFFIPSYDHFPKYGLNFFNYSLCFNSFEKKLGFNLFSSRLNEEIINEYEDIFQEIEKNNK